jgi:hypothetical protein
LDCCDGIDPPPRHEGQAWHRDGEYVRLTFAIDDITPESGGTQCMPGTHRAEELCGPSTPLPGWANDGAEARALDGRVQLVCPAGSCAVNYTTLWHRRPENLTASRRRVVFSVFKRETERLVENCKAGAAVVDLAGGGGGHTLDIWKEWADANPSLAPVGGVYRKLLGLDSTRAGSGPPNRDPRPAASGPDDVDWVAAAAAASKARL